MDSGIEAIEGQATIVLLERLARNVHVAALVTAWVLTTLTFLLARIFRREEKVSHTVARGVSLGASGHMRVKARRHVWCLATSSLPHSTYALPPGYAGLLKVQIHCPRPERLAARSVYGVNNPGQ